MNYTAPAGFLTEVNEGNEELPEASFPALACVASRAAHRFCRVGVLGLPTQEISNQSLEVTGRSASGFSLKPPAI